MKISNKPLVETADVSRGVESRSTQIKNALYVCGFFVALYFLLGFVGTWLGGRIPDGWERRMVSMVVGEAETDEKVETRHGRIHAHLMDGETLRALDYRLFTLEMDEPNAIAVPGGGIGLTEALLNEVETDIGLAFVLAHELGHHQHRHITRGLGRGLLLALAGSLVTGSARLDPIQAATQLAESGYSRKQERQADRYALEMIHRKYGTTEGALEFFESMAAEGDESAMQKYVGSHPLSEERIADLQAYAAELDAR